jgi:hypothetical protein
MSLRTKLLYSFGLLAVLPLLLMGLFQYASSMRTVERHLVAQVEQIAERAADELSRRHEVHVSGAGGSGRARPGTAPSAGGDPAPPALAPDRRRWPTG